MSLSKAKLPPSRSKLALERKAEEAVKKAKVERVERARVTDVMEGWGQPGGSQEFERGLRKVAQRGGMSFFSFFPFLPLFLVVRVSNLELEIERTWDSFAGLLCFGNLSDLFTRSIGGVIVIVSKRGSFIQSSAPITTEHSLHLPSSWRDLELIDPSIYPSIHPTQFMLIASIHQFLDSVSELKLIYSNQTVQRDPLSIKSSRSRRVRNARTNRYAR